MSNAADLAAALEGKANGSGWMACCPAHADSTPSLSISEAQDGRTLFYCHAGCSQDAVLDALIAHGLWQDDKGLTIVDLATAKKLPVELLKDAGWTDATYESKPAISIPYFDRKRQVVATQYRRSLRGEDRFRFKRGNSIKHLYGLERWRPAEITLLVEGSTDVLTARHHKRNCIGVASASGWDDKSFAATLKDCDLIIALIEPDTGGRKLYAALAKSKLRDKIRIVRMPEDMKDLSAVHCADPLKFDERLDALMKTTERIESGIVMVTAINVEQKALEWLVENILAFKPSMIAGQPGLGKSLLTLDLAAAVTNKPRYPWVKVTNGEVILLNAEDDAGDTTVPRLVAAGADLSKVHLLEAVRTYDDEGNSKERYFNLARDIERLEEALRERNGAVRLVVIDPISAYIGGVDAHSNAEVREVLRPLNDMGSRHRVTILMISHFNKTGGDAINRVMGSLAFVGAPRTAYAIVKDQDNPKLRLMLSIKQNVGEEQEGFAYRVAGENGVAVIHWEQGRVKVTADEALTSNKEKRDKEVENWFLDRLKNGSKQSAKLLDEAKALGFSKQRVKNVKRHLGIVSTMGLLEDGAQVWFMRLPGPARSRGSENEGEGPLEPLAPLEPLEPLAAVQGGQGVQEEEEVQGGLSRESVNPLKPSWDLDEDDLPL